MSVGPVRLGACDAGGRRRERSVKKLEVSVGPVRLGACPGAPGQAGGDASPGAPGVKKLEVS